jgi:hypothetical protein
MGVEADELKPQHKEQIMKMAITLKDFAKEEPPEKNLFVQVLECWSF